MAKGGKKKMVKKKVITDKELRDGKIKKVISLIQKLEKVHTQDIVEAACARYKSANVAKRNAEARIAAMEKELEAAKRSLR